MLSYITLIVCSIMMPLLYIGVLEFQKPFFQKEENQKRKLLKAKEEILVLVLSEISLVRIWFLFEQATFQNYKFLLLYFMLIGMTIFCMTDYWERIVPNKILLLWLMIFGILVGMWGLQDLEGFRQELPSIILGFVFCLISFGLGYVIGRGSMGAGDVKLSIIMGLFLTGEYVVGAILYGCVISAVYSLIQIMRKKLTRKDTLPFVPFLYIGLIIRYMIG